MVLNFQFHFVLIQLLAGLTPHLPTASGVVYYVLPTKPCPYNNSCPSGETCHTIDHYVSNSSHFFSQDHINVILYFMCGVHNCTKHMDICDLHTFAMIGAAAGRENVTITTSVPIKVLRNSKDKNNHMYTFTNVSIVRLENMTVNYISINFEGKANCTFTGKNVDFHGYGHFKSVVVSVINITGSQALLDNCTFQNNSFIRLQSSAMLTISDCIFYSHHHISYSAIAGNNCTLNLSGVVYFINNTIGDDHHGLECGAAIYLNSGDDMYVDAPHSILNVNRGASVHFINNTAIGCAGALQLKSTEMDVGNNVNMTFIGNKIIYRDSSYARGGAIVLSHSSIKVRTNASIQLSDNSGSYGGAIELLFRSSIHLYMNATIYFINNTAKISGGAIRMTSSNINITNATLYFINNSAQSEAGGAISMSDGIISIYEHAKLIM